jgi:hypothetical protein
MRKIINENKSTCGAMTTTLRSERNSKNDLVFNPNKLNPLTSGGSETMSLLLLGDISGRSLWNNKTSLD